MQFQRNAMTILPYDRNILDRYIRYKRFLAKVALAIKTTPMYASFFGHAQILADVQALKGKIISGVHMPYSADWVVGGNFPQFSPDCFSDTSSIGKKAFGVWHGKQLFFNQQLITSNN